MCLDQRLSESQDAKESEQLLGTIARIAEGLPDDAGVADHAASLAHRVYLSQPEEMAGRLALAGNVLPAINSDRVGQVFADMLVHLPPITLQSAHAVYVQTLRMRDSICPRQLAGLPSWSSEPIAEKLKSALLTITAYKR